MQELSFVELLNLPFWQTIQVSGEVALATELYRPKAQFVQALALEIEEYFPASQIPHVDDPAKPL